jgi:hypothetical protein
MNALRLAAGSEDFEEHSTLSGPVRLVDSWEWGSASEEDTAVITSLVFDQAPLWKAARA